MMCYYEMSISRAKGLIYNFIRLRVHSPPITAVSEKLPMHHGEPLSCVELPVMSHFLLPHD